ncbi:CamS family sex pheromone protein [Weissella muntiaci]|uniref:CamS family sex pheromone protein n=1 Tax=Weissella muntiaci TaxID=2508881 RepID=A0A6C2CCS9_9LACO|nr:CamS family sex pheromone protein [Weissella muntiaci]TYC51015.1 CamS family sex pheromone protein [Weissella muntiaci]
MRALKWIGSILAIIVLGGALVFFGNFFSKNSSSNTTTESSKKSSKGVAVTSTSDSSAYKTVVKNGSYLVSKARGITVTNNANNFSTQSFESGLLNFSKSQFSTSKYVFQEGQYLTSSVATNWLGRKSSTNPDGLNPEDNGKTDSGRNPMYLQSIEEQDFMTQSGSDLKLSGVVLGLAMNTQDSYQKEEYGATYTQDISDADRIAQGKTIAAEVVARYRKISGISADTPIYVALFAQSPDDSLVGGNFYQWTRSTNGTSLDSFTNLSQTTVVLPMQEGTSNNKSVAEQLNTSFNNFQTKVENFFPNVASMTGQARYDDSTLSGLNITITTQFYSETEIQSFADYVATQAPSYLPNSANIQIRIQTTDGVQALLVKKTNSSKYEVNILGSY